MISRGDNTQHHTAVPSLRRLQVGEHLGGSGAFTLLSPCGQQWQMSDLLREPDTPSLTMLHNLPGHQRECLMEAARLFLTNVQAPEC